MISTQFVIAAAFGSNLLVSDQTSNLSQKEAELSTKYSIRFDLQTMQSIQEIRKGKSQIYVCI